MEKLSRIQEKKEVDIASKVLAEAFYNDPLFQYFTFNNPKKYGISYIFKSLLKYTYHHGKIYTTLNKEGVIAYYDRNKDYDITWYQAFKTGYLSTIFKSGLKVLGRLIKFDEFGKQIHKECIDEPHKYLILLGVDPNHQKKGHGKSLLNALLKKLDDQGLPCYLETHNPDNIHFYKSFGFEVKAEKQFLDTDIIHYGMVRPLVTK